MDLTGIKGPVTTTRVLSVHLYKKTDLLQFALTHKNCKINEGNLWRCTHYADNFSVNIYSSGKNILFTKVLSNDEIHKEMTRLFGEEPASIELRNWSIKFKFEYQLNLDTLNNDLKNTNLNRIFNIIYKEKVLKQTGVVYPKETVQMNKQAFTAIILRPFKGTSSANITFTIFATGSIGATGLKSTNDVKTVLTFLHINLKPKLYDNTSNEAQRSGGGASPSGPSDLFAF
jgi:TATA-box binding protein (TBP) (component of TFIID and TFIIIB)